MTHICATQPQWVNTLRPVYNGQHFADDIFKSIFWHEKCQSESKFHWKYYIVYPYASLWPWWIHPTWFCNAIICQWAGPLGLIMPRPSRSTNASSKLILYDYNRFKCTEYTCFQNTYAQIRHSQPGFLLKVFNQKLISVSNAGPWSCIYLICSPFF